MDILKYVIKRNGERNIFDRGKIYRAMYKAFKETRDYVPDYDNEKLIDISIKIENRIGIGESIAIEDIQDMVQRELCLVYYDVFNAYTEHRLTHKLDRENPWSDMDERQEMILGKYLKKDETKKEFLERISIGDSELYKMFKNKEALWGGRNLYAIGRDAKITGSNCYVLKDPEDTLEDIYRVAYEMARTYSYGGGVGINISKLRPKNMKVGNASNTTPGIMTFAELYSHITLNTQQDNRRGALMVVLNVDHPDIIDFITTKLDLNKVNGANISIALDDKFMNAVLKDEVWTMEFETQHQKMIKKVKARDLMNLITYSNHTVGDPGMLFIDNVNNYHLMSEYEDFKFTATNPCGEQPLPPYSACNLGSINLNAFVRNQFEDNVYFDTKRFKEVVTKMIWKLDDLLDILGDRHPLPQQIEQVKQNREIGLGVMGLADLAISMGVAYGSQDFINILDEIMSIMINQALQSSALKARQYGTFPRYEESKVLSSSFIKKVANQETINMIKMYGLRNSRLLSIAPTGSISNVCGVSGGVEPFFMIYYNRTIKSMFEDDVTIQVVEKTPKSLMKHLDIEDADDLPSYAKVTSQNIDFKNRANVQEVIQKYVDTAISSTFNVPNDASLVDVENIYLNAWSKGLKGATIFRDNCKKVGILTGDSKHIDNNPATPPTIEVTTIVYDKDTGIKEANRETITIKDSGYEVSDIQKDICPECGSPLVKRGGCTKCSNNECWYEKCAL